MSRRTAFAARDTSRDGGAMPLLLAAAVSLALHDALLGVASWPETLTTVPATSAMNARLAPLVSPQPPAAPVVAPAAPAEARSTSVARPQPRPTPRVPAPSPVAAAPPPSSGEPTLAPRAGIDAPDAGSLAQYRLALFGVARRHRLYPQAAIDAGWQGRTEVRLVVGADGALAGTEIRATSGREILDREAAAMLAKAHALTPLAPALREREFAVDVKVVFEPPER